MKAPVREPNKADDGVAWADVAADDVAQVDDAVDRGPGRARWVEAGEDAAFVNVAPVPYANI